MKFFKKFFNKKAMASSEKRVGERLSIEGVSQAPMTAEPDAAEIAAQALLEIMSGQEIPVKVDASTDVKEKENSPMTNGPDGGVPYYESLAKKIRKSQEEARLRTLRFIAFCEQELENKDLPANGPGSLGLLEKELLKRIDVVDRCGGELKKRWQYCLSEVIVRKVNLDERKDEALQD